MKPKLSKPFELAIGPSSPVQKAVALLREFFSTHPKPEIADAQGASQLAANHLLVLLDASGMLNGAGMHSAAIVTLRSLEDALDVFCAISSVPGVAKRWECGQLKPSEAAKLWVERCGNPTISTGQALGDYRKDLRNAFHKYAHASYDVCLWDLYFHPQRSNRTDGAIGTTEINSGRMVIDSNGHCIDAHLTAHLYEFLLAVRKSFASALAAFDGAESLPRLASDIEEILKQHDKHGCQNVQSPAELRPLKK